MEFLSTVHEKKFEELIEKQGRAGVEHKTLFYIISGNQDLFAQVNKIYDFKQGMLCDRAETEEGELYFKGLLTSGSSKRLINLGVQLFNGTNKQNVLDTFTGLDQDNFKLAINAIKIRFNQQ